MKNQELTAEDPFTVLAESEAEDKRPPVLQPLALQMRVDLVVNSESRVWLLHDRYFEDLAMWAEYDIDTATLSLVMRDGRMQPLGMTIHPPIRKYLRDARQLYTMLLQDKKVIDSSILPLLVRETGHY